MTCLLLLVCSSSAYISHKLLPRRGKKRYKASFFREKNREPSPLFPSIYLKEIALFNSEIVDHYQK